MRGDGKTRCYDFTCKCTFRYLWMNAPLLIALACNLAFRISYFLILEATPDIQIWSNRSQTTDKSIKHTRYWAACCCAFQVRKWQQKWMGGEQVQRNFWLIVWRGYDLVMSPLGYFRSVWFWNDFEGSERCNEQCDGCSFYYYYYYYYRLLEKRMATLKSILYQMLFLFNILSKQYMFYSLLCQHSLKLNFIHPLLRSKEFWVVLPVNCPYPGSPMAQGLTACQGTNLDRSRTAAVSLPILARWHSCHRRNGKTTWKKKWQN